MAGDELTNEQVADLANEIAGPAPTTDADNMGDLVERLGLNEDEEGEEA